VRSRPARLGLLALFLLVTLGGGMLIGLSNPPGEWYAGLAKARFNPPDWAFPVAWTILYILIAVAGWRVFLAKARLPFGLWVLQLALNFTWTPTFFGLHLIGAGLVVLLAMLAAILAFIAVTWRQDRTAALLFVPYAAWVGFAGLLNGSIWWLN
jgi:benzodiazapine receptor